MQSRSIAFALAIIPALCGCGNDGDDSSGYAEIPPPVFAAPEASPTSSITLPSNPSLPDHNYDERRGSTYYYIAAVSEEDRKRGRAVGSVLAFQYWGQNADGEHILAGLRANGTVDFFAWCRSSCRIIDTDGGGKIAYSPTSIIGAAFEDAFRGKLRVVDRVQAEPASAQRPAEPQSASNPLSKPSLPANGQSLEPEASAGPIDNAGEPADVDTD